MNLLKFVYLSLESRDSFAPTDNGRDRSQKRRSLQKGTSGEGGS